METIPERDWKYLRSLHDELLNELSQRINDGLRTLLNRDNLSENEKRMKAYDLVARRDRTVAACFSDWRRSTIIERCWALRKQGLLKREHLEKLDPKTQHWISL